MKLTIFDIFAIIFSVFAIGTSLYGLYIGAKGNKKLIEHGKRIDKEDAQFRKRLAEALQNDQP